MSRQRTTASGKIKSSGSFVHNGVCVVLFFGLAWFILAGLWKLIRHWLQKATLALYRGRWASPVASSPLALSNPESNKLPYKKVSSLRLKLAFISTRKHNR